jgi:cytochrome b6
MSSSKRRTAAGALSEWFRLRLPLDRLSYEHLKQKDVPRHPMSWAYFLGGLTLCALAVQVATGLLLMLYYQPSTAFAHESVRFIETAVPGGSLVRNMHAWSASALIVFLFLHASTVGVTRAYRNPRELTWLTGVVLLVCTLAMAFSGYLLPWSTLSVYATRVGTEILQVSTDFMPYPLSEAGALAATLLTGSQGVGQATLTRFYALHVVALPLLILAAIGAHLILIQLHGMSIPLPLRDKGSEQAAERFFPGFLLKECGVWLLFLGALTILAALLPYDCFLPYTLAGAFDPLAAAPAGIKPEWYFYFLYYPLEMLPRAAAISAAFAFFVALAAAPWLLRWLPSLWGASFENSKFPTVTALAASVFVLLITLFGGELVRLVRGLP